MMRKVHSFNHSYQDITNFILHIIITFNVFAFLIHICNLLVHIFVLAYIFTCFSFLLYKFINFPTYNKVDELPRTNIGEERIFCSILL